MPIKIPEAYAELFVPARYKIYYGGRGGAKTHNFGLALLTQAAAEPLRVLCCRELQVSINDSVHQTLADLIASYAEFGAFEVQQKLIKHPNGSEFVFKGLKHNATEIKGFHGIDRCWVEEGQVISKTSIELLRPTIRKPGSEIWISFNPKLPSDPIYKTFVLKPPADSIIRKVNYSDNPFFPDVLEQERLDCLKRDPEGYKHIWLGEFDTRYEGLVYGKQMQKVFDDGRFAAYDPALKVYTAWDIGWGDATAIVFFQRARGECRIIDCLANSNEELDYYVSELKAKPYRYERHYLPHDAVNKLLAAGGKSVQQQLEARGLNVQTVRATSQKNQIEALRYVFARMWFDRDKCDDLIQALFHYHFGFNDKLERSSEKPVHDWASHYCDALEIVAQVWQDEAKPERTSTAINTTITFDDLLDDQPAKNPYKRIF